MAYDFESWTVEDVRKNPAKLQVLKDHIREYEERIAYLEALMEESGWASADPYVTGYHVG